MGLLDFMGSGDMDDPKTQATLALASGLLSTRGMRGLVQGMQGYQQTMSQHKQQQMLEQARQMQLEQHALQLQEARKRQHQADLDQRLMAQQMTPISGTEANRASGITGPRPEALGVVGQLPRLDVQSMNRQGMSPQAISTLMQLTAKEQPKLESVKPGETLGYFQNGQFKQVFQAPDKAANSTEVGKLLAEMQALPEGDPRRSLYESALRKATTHTPGTNVNVNTGPKAFDNELGKFAVDAFAKQREAAQAAAGTLQSIGEIRKAAAGGAYQGTGAELKLGAAKALGALGLPYDKAAVENSELFSAQANQFVLNSIKGLGANPSNADREFIEKTVPRLQTDPAALPALLSFMENKARAQLKTYNQGAKNVQKRADYLPFGLEVPEPEANDGWGIRPIGAN